MDSEQRGMIDELLEVESGLTNWEVDFLESIDRRDFLTPAQDRKLRQIWDEKT